VSAKTSLERLECLLDSSGVACRIEAMLPVGPRRRQLSVRTLLIGMLLAAQDGRPAHLRRVHAALISLPEAEQLRLSVIATWKSGEHLLTYRQIEYTFALIVRALSKEEPDGAPSQLLCEVLDQLLEASVKVTGDPASSSYAIDWTDLEAWARPPRGERPSADPEAAFGHRTANAPGEGESFFGYYLQAATIVGDEGGEAPELVRRIHLASCRHDPPAQIVSVIERMARDDIAIGDVLADCGYSYRAPETFALPIRTLGAELIIDLHPNDRGSKGTHMGAVIANGNLYCPATPAALIELSPLAPGASGEQAAAHERRCQELHRYKLSPLTSPDRDGYHRAACPAAAGKVRCPLRPQSMTLSLERPTILSPPPHPPVCCTQQTITVPPQVNAKTKQKHDYPSKAHRHSYARRSAAERTFAGVKDPATNDISRGRCRLMGLTPIALFCASAFIARNLRIADVFAARQAEERCEHSPRPRRRRRRTIHDLAMARANAPPG
jgi:hypothetical protein